MESIYGLILTWWWLMCMWVGQRWHVLGAKIGISTTREIGNMQQDLEQIGQHYLVIGRRQARTGRSLARAPLLAWGRPWSSTKVGHPKAKRLTGSCMSFASKALSPHLPFLLSRYLFSLFIPVLQKYWWTNLYRHYLYIILLYKGVVEDRNSITKVTRLFKSQVGLIGSGKSGQRVVYTLISLKLNQLTETFNNKDNLCPLWRISWIFASTMGLNSRFPNNLQLRIKNRKLPKACPLQESLLLAFI